MNESMSNWTTECELNWDLNQYTNRNQMSCDYFSALTLILSNQGAIFPINFSMHNWVRQAGKEKKEKERNIKRVLWMNLNDAALIIITCRWYWIFSFWNVIGLLSSMFRYMYVRILVAEQIVIWSCDHAIMFNDDD